MEYLVLIFGFVSQLGTVRLYKGPKMGVVNKCDDAKNNLAIDWDLNFQAFTCMQDSHWVAQDLDSKYYQMPHIDPRDDVVYHHCMKQAIKYDDQPPLRGDHRPNWAKYGEYLYVPPQRWLHNLEHGAIIMLYHPCADPEQVQKLRYLVTSCLYRHIITPYSQLAQQYPLALVAWGAKLEMNSLDIAAAVRFMQKHARLAPEDLSKQGKYELFLLNPAKIVSDQNDSTICPWGKDDKQFDMHLNGIISPLDHLQLDLS